MNNLSNDQILILEELNKNGSMAKHDIINNIIYQFGTGGDYLSMSYAVDYLVTGALLTKNNDYYSLTQRGLLVLKDERNRLMNISNRLRFNPSLY